MYNKHFYKNIELANELQVSAVTVGRYIDMAVKGGNALELIDHNNKPRIRRSDKNLKILKELTGSDSKFKNKGLLVTVKPKKIFYDTFKKAEIIELINSIENKKHIPIKFSYLAQKSNNHKNHLIMENTSEVLQMICDDHTKYIIKLCLNNEQSVNVVELGANSLKTTSKMLKSLDVKNLLNSYCSIDLDEEGLLNVEKNFKELGLKNCKNFKTIKCDLENTIFKNYVFNYLKMFSGKGQNFLEEQVIKQISVRKIIPKTSFTLFVCNGLIFSNHKTYTTILNNLSDLCSKKDLLIFDANLDCAEIRYLNKVSKESEQYSFLKKVLELFDIPEENIVFSSKFNDDMCTRDYYFEIIEKTEIIFDKLYPNQEVVLVLKKRECVNVMSTKLSNFLDNFTLLEAKNFELLKSTNSDNQKYTSFLVKKI